MFQAPRPAVPVTTCGITLEQSAPRIYVYDEYTGREVRYKVNHLSAIEVFEEYTIDELRYYDYVKYEVCPPASPVMPRFVGRFGI